MAASFPELDVESDTSLLEPDMDQLREDRFQRNRAFLQTVNPRVAQMVLPSSSDSSAEECAATNIQRWWRGYQGRKTYATRLYYKYLKEEEQQHQKTLQQMEEGELLVENHQLEVLLDDNKTTRRNADRLLRTKVIIIQRAWRKYIESKQQTIPDKYFNKVGDGIHSNSNHSNSNQATPTCLGSRHDSENRSCEQQDQCSNTVEAMAGIVSEADKDNADSHSSALNGSCKDVTTDGPSDHTDTTADGQTDTCLDNVNQTDGYIIDSDNDNTSSKCNNLTKESAEELSKSQRKDGYLAQAKEFVELKKQNANALPFNLHMLADDKDTDLADKDKDKSKTPGANTNTNMVETVTKSDSGASKKSKSGENSMEAPENEKSRSKPPEAGKTENKSAGKAESKADGGMTTSGESLSAFEVYNIETALPEIDWHTLEESLKAASEEEKKAKEARRNDREEIRKKLAMGGDDDDSYYDDNEADEVVGYTKKPNFQSRLHSGLQICFMNESPGDTDSEGRSPRQHEFHDNMKMDPKVDDLVDSDNNLRSVQDLNQTASTSGTCSTMSAESCSPPRLKPYVPPGVGLGAGAGPGGEENSKDFQSRQEQLQNEAKLALAQAGTMAHMQLEIEKQLQKKSPMAEMVGIPGLGERRRKKLSVRQLQEMNLASIQVLYNDLQTQIENLNEELVHLLMERDELHMEQDSMLVDIEDLTRRAEELSDKGKDGKDVKNNVKGKLPAR